MNARRWALAGAVVVVVSGSGIAAGARARTTKASLPAPTAHRVAVLHAREQAVAGALGTFGKLGARADVAPWEARLRSAEAAQAKAEAALNATLALPAAPSSPRAKSTSTSLAISQVNLPTKDVQQWKATVRPAAASLPAGALKLVLSIGPKTLATFTTTAKGQSQCTITIPSSAMALQASGPDHCAGGIGGYVDLTSAEIQSPSIEVRAQYVGAPGWKPSKSGGVNPMEVSSGQTVRSS